jgi:hypothetical protein
LKPRQIRQMKGLLQCALLARKVHADDLAADLIEHARSTFYSDEAPYQESPQPSPVRPGIDPLTDPLAGALTRWESVITGMFEDHYDDDIPDETDDEEEDEPEDDEPEYDPDFDRHAAVGHRILDGARYHHKLTGDNGGWYTPHPYNLGPFATLELAARAHRTREHFTHAEWPPMGDAALLRGFYFTPNLGWFTPDGNGPHGSLQQAGAAKSATEDTP